MEWFVWLILLTNKTLACEIVFQLDQIPNLLEVQVAFIHTKQSNNMTLMPLDVRGSTMNGTAGMTTWPRVESIVEKGENAGYQYFLPFPHCLKKVFSTRTGLLKSEFAWWRIKLLFSKYGSFLFLFVSFLVQLIYWSVHKFLFCSVFKVRFHIMVLPLCRWQFFNLAVFWKDNFNMAQIVHFFFFFWWGRKHCGKRRKCWFPAFSPFPTMF